MSEFSESYHLRTNNKEEGKSLIKHLGVRGIVFEETNGWVTVLPEGELASHIKNIASNFNGMVLHYTYAADHFWTADLFSNGTSISSFVCSWDPELYIDSEALNIEAFSKLLLRPEDKEKLVKLFSLTDLDEIIETKPAYVFAELLGIEHYQWLAGHDIANHCDEILEGIPGSELV